MPRILKKLGDTRLKLDELLTYERFVIEEKKKLALKQAQQAAANKQRAGAPMASNKVGDDATEQPTEAGGITEPLLVNQTQSPRTEQVEAGLAGASEA